MTIKNLIEKYKNNIENLTDGMSLFEGESSAIRAGYLDQIEIYETVIADLQDLAQKQGDLISRSEAEKLGATCLARRNENGQLEAIISLDNAPTVDVIPNEEGYEMYGKGYCKGYLQGYEKGKNERPQGEWIARNDETHYCSNCRGDAIDGDFDEILTTFCPHCGAEMKGGAE